MQSPIGRRRPSPAMVVACVALSFALAGSAVAGTEAVTSKLNKQEKKQVKRIAKRIANKQAKKKLRANVPGSHVNLADQATTAGSASPSGPAGGDLTGTYPNPLIGDGKVTTAKIANLAVTTAKIAAGAVGNAQLADNAVDSAKVANDTLTADDLAPGSVTASEIDPVLSAFESGKGGDSVNVGIASPGAIIVNEGGTNFPGVPGIIIAKASFDNTAGAARFVECSIRAPDNTVIDHIEAAHFGLEPNGANDDDKSITLMGFDDLLAGNYTMNCFATSGVAGDVEASDGSIAIIPAAFGEVSNVVLGPTREGGAPETAAPDSDE